MEILLSCVLALLFTRIFACIDALERPPHETATTMR